MIRKKSGEWIFGKKGGERWLSLWWFFVIIIIAGSLVGGVTIYYGQDLDVRGIEASYLSERIVDCVLDNGVLRNDFIENGNAFDVYSQCKLRKEIFEEKMFYKIVFYSVNEKGDVTKNFFVSSREVEGSVFEESCKLSENSRTPNFATCSINKIFVNYLENGKMKEGYLEVLTASNQKGGKIGV